ncbi:hypothetical protein MMC13_002852 [Lambiella insularis]|nr:hypothetical protein [Lambiella insularis]
MSSSTHAAEHVLRLSELVTTILSFLENDPSTLNACVRVNKLWAKVSVMLMWKRCGLINTGPQQGQPPAIQDLASISPSHRLQYYANHILELEFKDNLTYDLLDSRTIKFPHLWKLFVHTTTPNYANFDLNLLQPYLQPNLRRLSLHEIRLSDVFLLRMQIKCPALTYLEIKLTSMPDNTLSTERIAAFVDAMRYLEELDVCNSTYEFWEANVFEAFTRHQRLKALGLPCLPEKWPQGLEPYQSKCFPPNLSSFTVKVNKHTAPALNTFSFALRNVVHLHLILGWRPGHALKLATQATQLKSLRMSFQGNITIEGEDLMMLAKHCSQLEVFELPPVSLDGKPSWDRHLYDGVPESGSVTDEVIEEMAKYLPNLKSFVLFLEDDEEDSVLTERSLIHLGTNCRDLELCGLYADVSIEAMVFAQQDLFSRLQTLLVRRYQDSEARETTHDAREIAARFFLNAPRLTEFWIGTTDLDEGHNRVVEEIQRVMESLPGHKFVLTGALPVSDL